MIDQLKKDASIGDELKLYLITGETVVGTILDFGENNIIIDVNGTQKRFFTTIIGGWEVQQKPRNTVANANLEVFAHNDNDNNSTQSDPFLEDKSDKNVTGAENISYPIVSLFDENKREKINSIIDKFENSLSEEKKNTKIESNANIIEVKSHKAFVITYQNQRIDLPVNKIGDYRLNIELQSYNNGESLPVYVYGYLSKISIVLLPGSISDYIKILRHLIFEDKNFFQAQKVCTIINRTTNNNIIKHLNRELSRILPFYNLPIRISTYKSQIDVINSEIETEEITSAISNINLLLDNKMSNKDRATLLLKKAQLLVIIERTNEAVETYRELIIFQENNKVNDCLLSNYYTDLAKIFLLQKEIDQANSSLEVALSLNSQNIDALRLVKKLGIKNIGKKINNTLTIDALEESLIEHDIDEYVFVDSEIVALNGVPNLNIASRILETANNTNNIYLYLEAAKAFKSLQTNTYDYNDFIEALKKYSYLKCSYLFNSFSKIIKELPTAIDLPEEQLLKIKDCAFCYYSEAFSFALNYDINHCSSFMLNCAKMNICIYLIKEKKELESIQKVLEMSMPELGDYCINSDNVNLFFSYVDTYISLSTQNNDIWEKYLIKDTNIINIAHFIKNNTKYYSYFVKSLGCTHISQNSNNFLGCVIAWTTKYTRKILNKLVDIANAKFDLFTLNYHKRQLVSILLQTLLPTDGVSLQKIINLVDILRLYPVRSSVERKNIINKSLDEIDIQLKWNAGDTTKLGHLFFAPLLRRWKAELELLTDTKEEDLRCSISVTLDPPYYIMDKKGRRFSFAVTNMSQNTLEGFRIAIFTSNKKMAIVVNEKTCELQPQETKAYSYGIPKNWGEHEIFELSIVYSSLYMTKWSKDEKVGFTLSRQPEFKLKEDDLKWKEKGVPAQDMFKGRDEIVQRLVSHYTSEDRHQTYVLYGLSRTGKSSILEYLKKNIVNKTILKNDKEYKILPFILDLGAIHGNSLNSIDFWNNLLSSLEEQKMMYIYGSPLPLNIEIIVPSDFTTFIRKINELYLHPLIMFDEFSFMKSAIDDEFVNSSFLQLMRNISGEKDLVSFIYAGTYDIKQLIHDPEYNISGSSVYLIEPKKPIYEIPYSDAEELINAMGDKLRFTAPAIKEIHKLSGDVPFWIQIICRNCGRYAIENNIPVIGLYELESIVKILTGESDISTKNESVKTMSSAIFEKTQTLPSDTVEIKILLTSIAYYLTNKEHLDYGVTYEQLLDFWNEIHFKSTKYKFTDAFQALLERNTLIKEKVDNHHYYRFSIDLFRRWWAHNHDDLSVQLS